MTTEEFWEKYTNENILDIYDITCDFFSKELPTGFLEEYDAGEVILETIEKNVSAKEFGRVMEFIGIIRENHPDLYHENFQYIDGHLIDYYCFYGEVGEVEKSFSNFLREPVQGFDMYYLSFITLLFYQYNDLLNTAVEENYDRVADCDKLLGSPEYSLAIWKLYMELDGLWQMDSLVLPQDRLLKVMERYGFDPDAKLTSTIEHALFADVLDMGVLLDDFNRDRTKFRFTLQWYFMKYAKAKDIGFGLSGRIYEKMLSYWEANLPKTKKGTHELYFDIKPAKLEKHFAEQAGSMFYDNRVEMAAVLWGCVYIYDFLLSVGLISKTIYWKFINESKRLKGIVICQFTSDLWKTEFVHTWQKPDSVSETEFLEEQKIFRKSIEFKPAKFSDLKENISEELENIGELASFIIEAGKKEKVKLDLSKFDNLLKALENDNESYVDSKEIEEYDGVFDSDDDQEELVQLEPVRTEPKIGRNEPCPCGSGKKYKKCCLD
jgi:hypothetical protein